MNMDILFTSFVHITNIFLTLAKHHFGYVIHLILFDDFISFIHGIYLRTTNLRNDILRVCFWSVCPRPSRM